MAKQTGILPVKGTLGNLTFYKSKDGYLVREKGGLDAKRIASDPAFQRTRENNAEFGKAGKATKLLRNALRSFSQNASDSKVGSRLTKEMMRVIKADGVNPRGQRNVIDGEAELLQDFDFNVQGKLSTTLYAPYTAAINRVTGALSVEVPAFVPENMLAAPAGVTHFKFNLAGTEIDFEGNKFVVETQSTPELPWDNVVTNAISLSASVTANSTHPLFLVFGVEFYQEVNGSMYPLKNGAFNSLCLVKVSGQ